MVRSELATEAAVKQFQEIQTLEVDGQVGPNTQATLCSELQNLTVESGVGEFLGMGEAVKSGDLGIW